jgi:AcrR family transcriptional regulator
VNTCWQQGQKPLRRDAERNRQRILQAARTLIAEQGLGVSHDQVAEAADVAVGTVYRRFPDKESLFEALFAEQVDGIVESARSALGIEDPWQALVAFMTDALEICAGNRGLKDIAMGGMPNLALACRAQEQISPIVDALVSRAHAANMLRPGIGAEDFALVPIMVSAVIDSAWGIQPELWRRTLTIVLDGFRCEHREPLPDATPTADQLLQIKTGWHAPSH